jgi:hypothetical protein
MAKHWSDSRIVDTVDRVQEETKDNTTVWSQLTE